MIGGACQVPTCRTKIDIRMLMCKPHWAKVPHLLQQAVYRTWRGRTQLRTKEAIAAHEEAKRRALAALNPKEKT